MADTAKTTAQDDEQPDDGADALTVGERHQLEAYADFRKALEALPGAAAFQALVVEYGQQFGYRTVGRWIAGRGPKAPKAAPPHDTEAGA